MSREAEVADPALLFLLDEVIDDAVLFVLICRQAVFVDGSLVFFQVALDERVIEFVDFVFAKAMTS